jgi:hypothetical protein
MARFVVVETVWGEDNVVDAAKEAMKSHSHLFDRITVMTVTASQYRIGGGVAAWDVELTGERGPIDG